MARVDRLEAKMHPLEKFIYEKGWTMRKFCASCGIDRCTLHKLFNGTTKRLHPLTIYKIANALGEPYEVIYTLSTEGL